MGSTSAGRQGIWFQAQLSQRPTRGGGGLKQLTLLLGPQIHHLQWRVFKAVIFQVVFLLSLF